MTVERATLGAGDVPALEAAPVLRIGELPTRSIAPSRPSYYARSGKRGFDLVMALAILLAVSVPMLLIAVVLRLSLGRGVIYRQARVGLDGRTFTVLKFRTMLRDRRAEAVGAVADGHPDRRLRHKTTADPRHTLVGRFLRTTSLDELPQLFNVLRGDMSVVGPRPELVHLVDRMSDEQKARHVVRPGLTGEWQVSARGRLTLHEATDLDLNYIRRMSFTHDLSILVRTPAALFGRTGD